VQKGKGGKGARGGKKKKHCEDSLTKPRGKGREKGGMEMSPLQGVNFENNKPTFLFSVSERGGGGGAGKQGKCLGHEREGRARLLFLLLMGGGEKKKKLQTALLGEIPPGLLNLFRRGEKEGRGGGKRWSKSPLEGRNSWTRNFSPTLWGKKRGKGSSRSQKGRLSFFFGGEGGRGVSFGVKKLPHSPTSRGGGEKKKGGREKDMIQPLQGGKKAAQGELLRPLDLPPKK